MLWAVPEITIEGGADAAPEVRPGNSFADLVAGTMVPETSEMLDLVELTELADHVGPETVIEQTYTDQVVEAVWPEETQPTQAEAIDRRAPDDTMEVIQANTITEPVAAASTRQPNSAVSEIETSSKQLIAPALPTEVTRPSDVLSLAPTVTNPSEANLVVPAPIKPLEKVKPIDAMKPKLTEAFPAQTTLSALAPLGEALLALPDAGVQVSPRPPVRPKRVERQVEKRRTEQQQRRQQIPPVERGNAEQNAVAGSETGNSQANANRQSTSAGKSTSAGNATASNYPGQVMRCISRAGRPRISSRGTAVVAFSVTSSGRVTQVGIARSSGNARLDRSAMQTIPRAGPCPAPPTGARRAYQISIEGRG